MAMRRIASCSSGGVYVPQALVLVCAASPWINGLDSYVMLANSQYEICLSGGEWIDDR
jgi:hypothetical protein